MARTKRVDYGTLENAAINWSSPFQRKTLEHLLSKGWKVNMVQRSPSRKSTAITVTGPTFGIIQPNGMYMPAKGKVSWSWSKFDDLAAATIPNYNGLPIE